MADNRTFEVTVDYDEAGSNQFDPAKYFNSNPHIGAGHFSDSFPSGKIVFTLGYVELERGGTTQDALDQIRSYETFRFPDRLTTESFHAKFPDERKTSQIESFCGVYIELSSNEYIVYIHADNNGLSAFLNWMQFRRNENAKYLVVKSWRQA